MKLTIDRVMSYGPCYKLCKVEALFAGRETITLHDVAAMDIPDIDKIWLFCQENVLYSSIRTQWLKIIITRAIKAALTAYNEPSYVKWAENWLNGNDGSVCAARAANAAACAARAAANAAAYTAAYAAAHAAHAAYVAIAAADALADAANAAAYTAIATANAAYATADAADAEHKQQVADLMALLSKDE